MDEEHMEVDSAQKNQESADKLQITQMFLCIKPDNVWIKGATNVSTVTILYIARYCWRAGPYPTLYWCARSLMAGK